MTVEPIGFITLILGLIGLFLDARFLVCVFFGATLLGAAGAVILDSLGGTNIQPAHLLLGFVAIRLLGRRDIRYAPPLSGPNAHYSCARGRRTILRSTPGPYDFEFDAIDLSHCELHLLPSTVWLR